MTLQDIQFFLPDRNKQAAIWLSDHIEVFSWNCLKHVHVSCFILIIACLWLFLLWKLWIKISFKWPWAAGDNAESFLFTPWAVIKHKRTKINELFFGQFGNQLVVWDKMSEFLCLFFVSVSFSVPGNNETFSLCNIITSDRVTTVYHKVPANDK